MCKFIGYGLKESGANLNVVNILRTLVEDKDCKVFAPYNYDKESKSAHDPKVSFIPNAMAEVINLTSNQERFNVSITAILPVMVEGKMKKVFRNYSVIRDNKLNIKSLWARVYQYYDVLKNGGIIKNETNDGLVELDFTNIPLVSLNWAQPDRCHLYDMMKLDVELSSRLKELRKLIKEYKSELPVEESVESDFYTEERQSDNSEVKKETRLVECVVYDLPEYKVPQTPDQMLRDRYPDLKSAEEAKREMSKLQADNRFAIRMIIWAIECSAKKGSYEWSELTKLPRSKDKYFQTTTVKDFIDNNLVLRRMVYNKEV